MKKQPNHALIWIISLMIAIPLFIMLAGFNFILAAFEYMDVKKSQINLI